MYSLSWLRFGGVGLVLLCLVLAGCDSKNARAKVKGKVKFFDKHLTCGTVSFITKDGRTGSGNIDFDGNYEVGDAPIGECIITVTVPQPPKGGPGTAGPPKPPPGVPEARPPGSSGTGPAPIVDPSKIVAIPEKYGSKDTSNLTFTVEKGDNTHNITLTP